MVDARSSPFAGGEAPADLITSTSGAAYRMVADFGANGTPPAWINSGPGNPGEPDHPLATSNLSDWRDGRYRRFPFSEAETSAAAFESATLSP